MPFEPELFDVEPPLVSKVSEVSAPVTYASVVSAENMTTTGTTSGTAGGLPNAAVVDLKELLSIPGTPDLCSFRKPHSSPINRRGYLNSPSSTL